jgi:hypothetical protein
MADKRISELQSTSAVGTSVVPVSNASGTATNKVTLADIAALGGGTPAAHKESHSTGGSDALSASDIGALSFVGVPANTGATGQTGQIAIDGNYLYVYAGSSWKVIPLVAFGSNITPPPSYSIAITQQPSTELIGTYTDAVFSVEYQVSHAGNSSRFWEFSDNNSVWNLLTSEGSISQFSSSQNGANIVTNNISLTVDWSKHVLGRTYRLRVQSMGAEAVTNVVGTLVISYLVTFVNLPSNKYLGSSGANVTYSYKVNDQGQSLPQWQYSDDLGITWDNVTTQGVQSSSSLINPSTLDAEISGGLFVNSSNFQQGRKYRLSVQTLNNTSTTDPVEVFPCAIASAPNCPCGLSPIVDENGCTQYECNVCSSSSSS